MNSTADVCRAFAARGQRRLFLHLTAKALGTRSVEFNLLHSRERYEVRIFSVCLDFSHPLSCQYPYTTTLASRFLQTPIRHGSSSDYHLFSAGPLPQGFDEKRARFRFSLRPSPFRGWALDVPQPCHRMEVSPLARCIPPLERARTPIHHGISVCAATRTGCPAAACEGPRRPVGETGCWVVLRCAHALLTETLGEVSQLGPIGHESTQTVVGAVR